MSTSDGLLDGRNSKSKPDFVILLIPFFLSCTFYFVICFDLNVSILAYFRYFVNKIMLTSFVKQRSLCKNLLCNRARRYAPPLPKRSKI